jgi:hypothetical protein
MRSQVQFECVGRQFEKADDRALLTRSRSALRLPGRFRERDITEILFPGDAPYRLYTIPSISADLSRRGEALGVPLAPKWRLRFRQFGHCSKVEVSA